MNDAAEHLLSLQDEIDRLKAQLAQRSKLSIRDSEQLSLFRELVDLQILHGAVMRQRIRSLPLKVSVSLNARRTTESQTPANELKCNIYGS